jgi:hypothetical protein
VGRVSRLEEQMMAWTLMRNPEFPFCGCCPIEYIYNTVSVLNTLLFTVIRVTQAGGGETAKIFYPWVRAARQLGTVAPQAVAPHQAWPVSPPPSSPLLILTTYMHK